MADISIMIVEDEAITALELQAQLEDWGYGVPAIAMTGKEALEKAEETQPDLVLMDIVLKGDMDGIEAAQQIRARYDIPVVYLTAYADKNTLARSKVTEPYGYILKPFDDRELQVVISIALYKHSVEKQLRKYREHLEELVLERTSKLALTNEHLRREIVSHKQTGKALQEAKEAAEGANRAKSLFLANMSHEIRTPLNSIIGMTRLALHSGLNPEQHKFINRVKQSADGLEGLLNDILDFSKIDAGQLIMEERDFSLAAMLDQIHFMMGFGAAKKGLELIIQSDLTKLPRLVKGDELRLRQVLVNLIGNSIKFTPKGYVTVSVTSEKRGDDRLKLHFTVADTGIGISAEKQETIFDSFSQGDSSTTREFGGTGLGLTICKQLVEMMGGQIRLESIEGQGAYFHFTVVLGYGDENKVVKQDDVVGSTVKGLTILLVEDNEFNRLLASTVLEIDRHRVIEAENGLKALEILGDQDVDLIFMDVQMTVMDGLTASAIIRACEKNCDLDTFDLPAALAEKLVRRFKNGHVPIVALTAHTMSGDQQRCLAAGMDEYMTKPFKPEVMAATISRLVLKASRR